MKIAALLAPVVMIGVILLVKIFAVQHYHRLIKEDGALEYFQVLCYGAAGLLSLLIFRRFRSIDRPLLAAAYLVLAIGMFLVAAEEISWGQRLAGVATPSALMQMNAQGEITIHNLRPIQPWLPTAYIVVGLVGGLAWSLVPRTAWGWRQEFLRNLLPGPLTTLYFLPVAGFYLCLQNGFEQNLLRSEDQEVFEAILAAGFALFTSSIFARAYAARHDHPPSEAAGSMG